MRHRYTVAPTAKWRDSTVPWRKKPDASKSLKKIDDTVELILRATVEYNRSLHSVTECRPVEAMQ